MTAIAKQLQWAEFQQLVPEANCPLEVGELLATSTTYRVRQAADAEASDVSDGVGDEVWRAAAETEWAILSRRWQDLAYKLWEEECYSCRQTVHGRDLNHWFEAERQLTEMAKRRSQRSHAKVTANPPAPRLRKGAQGSDCAVKAKRVDYGTSSKMRGRKSRDGGGGMPENHDHRNSKFHGFEKRADGSPVPFDPDMRDYENKIVITDNAETEVLVVVESPEELDEVVATPQFITELKNRFGSRAAYLIHNGPPVGRRYR